MFATTDLKLYDLVDNGKIIGSVRYNPHFSFKDKTTRPFIRCKLRIIETIGRVNYEMLDQFIIASLNDYYNKLLNIKEMAARTKATSEYQQLYYLWQTVMQAKQNRDSNLNSYYDDLVYRLYLLGYRN